MQKLRRLLFPALTICFVLLLGGYWLGRRSGTGPVLSTQRSVPIQTEAAQRSLPSPGGETTAHTEDGRLDLNRATAEELMRLPGIGEALAGRILAYRAEHGSFQYAAELMNVSGIGEKTFAKLRDLVYVEERNEDPDY